MDWIKVMGFLAGSCTTLAVVPQIYKAWKTGEAENVSLNMYLVLLAGLAFWVIYGLGINDLPIMVFNGIAFLLNLFMVYLIIKKGKENKT